MVNHPGDLVVTHPRNELDLEGTGRVAPARLRPRLGADPDRIPSEQPLVLGRTPAQTRDRHAARLGLCKGFPIGPANGGGTLSFVDDGIGSEQADEANKIAVREVKREPADDLR